MLGGLKLTQKDGPGVQHVSGIFTRYTRKERGPNVKLNAFKQHQCKLKYWFPLLNPIYGSLR